MEILFWSHGDSFPKAFPGERKWVLSYAEGLTSLGHKVSFSHSLTFQRPTAGLIHIFGSGHLETIPNLIPFCKQIWLSPLPFSVEAGPIFEPESQFSRRFRWLWRAWRQKSLWVSDERNWLKTVNYFPMPEPGIQNSITSHWPKNRILGLSRDPVLAAAKANEYLRALDA